MSTLTTKFTSGFKKINRTENILSLITILTNIFTDVLIFFLPKTDPWNHIVLFKRVKNDNLQWKVGIYLQIKPTQFCPCRVNIFV